MTVCWCVSRVVVCCVVIQIVSVLSVVVCYEVCIVEYAYVWPVCMGGCVCTGVCTLKKL